jgi:hypothetical protein
MAATPHPTDMQPTFLASICWPIIIVALLLGHVTLMMVAMTLANSGPSQIIDTSVDATIYNAPAPPEEGGDQ